MSEFNGEQLIAGMCVCVCVCVRVETACGPEMCLFTFLEVLLR